MGVHTKPEQVFILNQNRCSLWGRIRTPVFWSAIAEAVDYGEHKTGQRVAGLSFGGISFCQKAGMGVAGAVVGWLLAGFGYQPDVAQSELALTGIALMLTVIPGVFHYGVGVLMQRYRITDAAYRQLLAELQVTPVARQAVPASSAIPEGTPTHA